MSGAVDQLTSSERKKIAIRARRRLGQEAVLILTFGFAVLCVLYFFMHKVTLVPFILWSGLPFAAAMLVLAFGTSVILCIAHVAFWRSRLQAAREQHGKILHDYQRVRRQEIEERIERRGGAT